MPPLPSFDVPSATYQAGVPVSRVLNNLGQEGDGFRSTFTVESWPEGKCVDLMIQWRGANNEPWQDWISADFYGGPVSKPGNPPREVSGTWPFEPNRGGKAKGDLNVTLIPAQTFTTAIHVELFDVA